MVQIIFKTRTNDLPGLLRVLASTLEEAGDHKDRVENLSISAQNAPGKGTRIFTIDIYCYASVARRILEIQDNSFVF